jgi:hypothetical protein
MTSPVIVKIAPGIIGAQGLTPHSGDTWTTLRLVDQDPRGAVPPAVPNAAGLLLAVRLGTGLGARGWATQVDGTCYLLVSVESGSGFAWRPVKVGAPWTLLDCMGNPRDDLTWLRCG